MRGSIHPGPSQAVVAVTPNDSTDIATARGFMVNVAGNIKITDGNSGTPTLTVLAGVVYPIVVTRVWSTGTTATGIFALY